MSTTADEKGWKQGVDADVDVVLLVREIEADGTGRTKTSCDDCLQPIGESDVEKPAQADADAAARMIILRDVGIIEDDTERAEEEEEDKLKTSALVRNYVTTKTHPPSNFASPEKEQIGHCSGAEEFDAPQGQQDNAPPLTLSPGIPINTSVPGAHHSIPSWSQNALPSPPALYNEATLCFGIDQEDSVAEEGLVMANPVCTSNQPAEPVDIEQQVENQKKRAQQKDRDTMLRFAGLSFLFLALVGIGLAIGLSVRGGDKPSIETGDHQMQNYSAAKSPNIWKWDLPFNIPNATVRTIQLDEKGTTPQSRAYSWMKGDPYLNSYTQERLVQRFVMVLFYFATGGEQWINQGGGTVTVTADATTTLVLAQEGVPGREHHGGSGTLQDHPPQNGSSQQCCAAGPQLPHKKQTRKVNITSEKWLSYDHSECDWFSFVTAQPDLNISVCNHRHQVEALDLMSNHLQGTLPEELGLLSSLSYLNIGRNQVEGPIISELGSLRNLTALHLVSNAFTGTVPSEITLLSNLRQLGILHNDLSGALPYGFWNLPNVEELKIDNLGLSGSFPSDVGNLMPNLKLLLAGRNAFSGTLPSSLGKATDLFRVSANHNALSGSLPSELGNLANMTTLLLSYNSLSGMVPSQLGQVANLVDLRLDGNPSISGLLPSELWNLSRLEVLRLEGTSVSGTIPDAFCNIAVVRFDCSSTLCGCECPCRVD